VCSLRLIEQWLKAGVFEEGQWKPTAEGTPQGATVSPLPANVYPHYVFDLWAERWRKHHASGQVSIVRYADDIVVGFEKEQDARTFLEQTRERLGESSNSNCTRKRPESSSSDGSLGKNARGRGASRKPFRFRASRTSADAPVRENTCCIDTPTPNASEPS
jgi:hypothetical protein